MSSTSLLKKAFSSQQQITKQQISNILFVFKQIVSVLIGVGMGMTDFKGITAMILYSVISFGISYIYVLKILQPQQDTIQISDIFKQHWGLGFINFILSWIIAYNVINF